jgi:cytochrome c oxidase subunit 2
VSGSRGRPTFGALLAAVALLAAACARNAPQDSLSPAGPVARQSDDLFHLVFWIATAIFVLVEGLLVVAMVRFRRRSERDAPKQIHGNKRLEIAWTILPAALLAGIAVPTVIAIFDQAQRPVGATVLRVKVTGHQWWWEYEYPDITVEGGGPLRTANELVIPTGRWVSLDITSADVIHSFWVPRLAGKQDAVPGRTNFLKLRADQPGVYEGQCAEFCALSHANMRLRVIAQTPADFERWVERQRRPAPLPTDPVVLRILQSTCAACHTIRGVPNVVARVGPDLTHLASRERFAGASFPLTPENLARWLDDPSAMKPLYDPPESPSQAKMPDYNLTPAEIQAMVAYLMSLT